MAEASAQELSNGRKEFPNSGGSAASRGPMPTTYTNDSLVSGVAPPEFNIRGGHAWAMPLPRNS